MLLYILPNQLFNIDLLPTDLSTLVIWEHPHFFTKYNFNKKKLLLHRASMKNYFDCIKDSKKNIKCTYIDFSENHYKPRHAFYFDPIDNIKGFEDKSPNMLSSPNFFMNKQNYANIKNNKKSKKISFTNYFYPRCKKHLNFLVSSKSTDKYNRVPFNESIITKLIKKDNIIYPKKSKYITEATEYVNTNFENNYGNTEDFNFPISYVQAKEWLNYFIDYKLHHFGTYQDAFNNNHDNLFHSILSSSINIGILNPTHDILPMLQNYNTKDTPSFNGLEAFFRQLCWREFQRYCYIYYKKELTKNNYFKFKNKIDHTWYTSNTGILPVDNCIKKAFNTAYLHHIERLMIMGNYMILSELSPIEGHRWFMEFAIDSYEWVMLQNVYDMVFFNSNGLTTYKPYFTKSNYILKMSNYSSKSVWVEKWDIKYDNFLKKYSKKLQKYSYHFRNIKGYL
jgi:deoxyribodipyrimidine photolyase-related protein